MLFPILRSMVTLCVACLLFPSWICVAADKLDTQIQPLAVSSLILDIATAGEKLVAVGSRGHVLVSTDTWQQVPTPVNAQLTRSFFINPQQGWAVGHDATILHTQDGGHSWQQQMHSPEIEKPLLDVLFFNAHHGVAVGAYGLFYRTRDAGVTWQAEFHDSLLAPDDVDYLAELKAEDEALYLKERSMLLPHFNRLISLKDGRLLLVGELGLVAVSDDQGEHFTRTTFDYEGSIFNAIETQDAVYVMGLRGHVFKADQQLSMWQKVPMPVKSSINAALAVSNETLYLVGNAGVVMQLNPDNSTRMLARHQGVNFTAIAQDHAGKIWLAGSQGLLQLQP